MILSLGVLAGLSVVHFMRREYHDGQVRPGALPWWQYAVAMLGTSPSAILAAGLGIVTVLVAERRAILRAG